MKIKSQLFYKVKMQNSLNAVSSCCLRNGINVNISKTKLCCYGREHRFKNSDIVLNFRNSPSTKCHQYNYLGIILDKTINLESNFNSIFKKFSFKIFQFSKTWRLVPQDTRITVFKQTILPLVEYVSYTLLLNHKIDIEKFQKLQNHALRLCYNIYNPRDVAVSRLHADAKILKLIQTIPILYWEHPMECITT